MQRVHGDTKDAVHHVTYVGVTTQIMCAAPPNVRIIRQRYLQHGHQSGG